MTEELIRISKYAGMREDLVQASGGNSSIKLPDGRMLIKGLGIQLADVKESFGYAVVDLKVFRDFFLSYEGGEPKGTVAEELQDEAFLKGCKPAIETYFHALTDRVTLHTHPGLVNVLTARKGGMEVLHGLFPEALLLGYTAPGLPLGIELYEKMEQRTKLCFSGIAFMKNHGLLVSAGTVDEVIEKTEAVIERIAAYLKYDNAANSNVTRIYRWLSEKTDMSDKLVYCTANPKIRSGQRLLMEKRHLFCPDAAVFCGKEILTLEKGREPEGINGFLSEMGCPTIVCYEDEVYVIAPSVKKAKEIESVLAFCCEVAEMNEGYEVDLLTEQEVNYLLNWDIEKYRKNMQ